MAEKKVVETSRRSSLYSETKAVDSPGDTGNKHYDYVISGMGPVGLAFAFQMLCHGENVLIINNRDDDYIRVQHVVLSSANKEFLTARKSTFFRI